MSTPTPSHPPQPSSASKKTAGHVTTPSHLGLSPAPRSVPSPATTRRDQAGKTPTNHPTVSSTGSKTLGGTPMIPTLSQTGFTVGSASPGTQMIAGGGGSSIGLNFGTPLTGLGVDLSGVGGMPSAGSSGTPALMVTSVSELGRELGITVGGVGAGVAGGVKRNEDEERKVKMRKVLKSIGKPKGRVSEEGIARISRRVGFQNDIDAEKLTAEEKEKKVGNRTISIAGKTILVDVELRNNVTQNVQVMLSGSMKGLEEQGTQAGKVLSKDLAVLEGVLLDAKLDRFASNLDCLARIDRLSDRVNCFEAISGLYTSLKRLYQLEKDALKMSMKPSHANQDYQAEVETMCKKSGRPAIHENGKIGLSLDYWSTQVPSAGDRRESSAMDIDGQDPKIHDGQSANTFSIRIEVEPSPAAMYPSLRVSDGWLPEAFELPATGSGNDIPWQEPPPTYLSSDIPADQRDSMVIDETQKLPDLRFIAKLDPPVVMPLQTAVNISSMLQFPMPQGFPIEHYHAILLDATSDGTRLGPASFVAEQSVLNFVDGKETQTMRKYVLDISKPDWGYRLEELPFSHPRQLIDLLPTLRQWAHFGAIIKQVFKQARPVSSDPKVFNDPKVVDGSETHGLESISLDDIMAIGADSDHAAGQVLYLDITLVTSPQPAFSLMYPKSSNFTLDETTVQVLPNGDISIPVQGSSSLDINLDNLDGVVAKTSEQLSEAQKKAKALAACGDLGVWIEWLRSRQD